MAEGLAAETPYTLHAIACPNTPLQIVNRKLSRPTPHPLPVMGLVLEHLKKNCSHLERGFLALGEALATE